jgi:hypothetical protein
MVMKHRLGVDMEPFSMGHSALKPLFIHYISRDHPNSHEVIETFFLENSANFLETTKDFLNLNCAHFCRFFPITPDAHTNPCRCDWLQAYPKTDNSVPIQERTFQSAAAQRPVSWARPALKIAQLGTESNPLFLFVLSTL